jgi:putative DNA primase/helicase
MSAHPASCVCEDCFTRRVALLEGDPWRDEADEDGFSVLYGDDNEAEPSVLYGDQPVTGPRELAAPSNPMAVARDFIAERFTGPGGTLLLRHWRGTWWRWCTSCWAELEDRAVREAAYRFTEHAIWLKPDGNGGLQATDWAPTHRKIADLLEALAAICYLPETVDQPAWIDDAPDPGGVVVATANGLLHLQTRQLLAHDPRFFNQTAVPFAHDAEALEPARWLAFLEDLWGDDVDSIDALQEYFGYVISGRLDLQKILLLVGPTRGGKGAIARVLAALVGRANVAGPTLTSLGTDFGLAPLLGKPLAVISDARLNGRNTHVVVERLLSISGEDLITVNRKYRDQWTGKLPTRFMVISNELPHLGDASAAIVGRFVVLQLTRSWLGREDPALEEALHAELPGILNWALDGLDRLTASGRFTRPASTDEAIIALQDLASPVAAFVRDRCVRDLGGEVPCDDLYRAWKTWADDNGHKAGSTQTFGRNLRAVIPELKVARPRDGGDRQRVYRGVITR